MDAASNNGVDEIRNIVEQVNYAPLLGRYKVYIIDEVHMLSANAFNALLKTLEEPPAHVVFILATTDPQKIIPTVLSRCQRYNFSKISRFDMKKKMIEILEKEKLKYEADAVEEIAVLAEGGMRDALSILEQVLSYNEEGVFMEDVRKIFGLSSSEEKIRLLSLVHKGSVSEAINCVRNMYQSGIDSKRLAVDLLEIIKETLVYSDDADGRLLTKITKLQAMDILDMTGIRVLLNDAKSLEEVLLNDRGTQNFLSYLELCLIRMSGLKDERPAAVKEVKEEKTATSVAEPVTENEPVKEGSDVKETEEKEEGPVEEPENVSRETEETETEAEVSDDPVKQNAEKAPDPEEEQLRYLAALLLSASKDEKINDEIIFNKLDLYKNDPDKRKFYELIYKTQLFASCRDAVIVAGNVIDANNINASENRDYLYNFLVNNYGIDKVIMAFDIKKQGDLVSIYKGLVANRGGVRVPKIEKPQIKRERTNEEKLKELFGEEIRVEE